MNAGKGCPEGRWVVNLMARNSSNRWTGMWRKPVPRVACGIQNQKGVPLQGYVLANKRPVMVGSYGVPQVRIRCENPLRCKILHRIPSGIDSRPQLPCSSDSDAVYQVVP